MRPRPADSLRRDERAGRRDHVRRVRDAHPPYGFDRNVFDVVKRERIPTTIFVSGRWVEAHGDVMAELAADPLVEFGDHSYDHPHMSHLPVARIVEEIDQTEAALARYGKRSVAFRPPFGEWSHRLVYVVQDLRLPTVTWDVVSGDPSARTTSDGMIRNVLGKARAGFDHHLSHQRARLEDGGGAADDRAGAARARVPLRAAVGLDGVGVARRRAAAPANPSSFRSRSRPAGHPAAHRAAPAATLPPPPPPGPPPRDPRAAAAAPDRPRDLSRRAPAGRMDRRHRALEEPRVPRGRARPLSRAARPRRRGLDRAGRGRGRRRASSSRRTASCWAGSSRCWRSNRTRAARGWAGRWSLMSRPGCLQTAAGCSSRATPPTAPRCVSTDGRASRAWAASRSGPGGPDRASAAQTARPE